MSADLTATSASNAIIESGMPSTTELVLPTADSNGFVSAEVQDNVHEELQARYETTNANVSVENEEDIICAPCKTSRDTLPALPLGQVHCAQILDDKTCNMPGIPIFTTGGGRHICYGDCNREMHANHPRRRAWPNGARTRTQAWQP